MSKHWTVYMYTFPNGKRYIGATSKTLAQRQGNEFKLYKPCKKLWEAIQEFGFQNIQQDILFECDDDKSLAAEKEMFYISLYNTTNPELGYNSSRGGEGIVDSRHYSEPYAQAVSERMRKVGSATKGHQRSEQTISRWRESYTPHNKGKSLSDETKSRISASVKQAYEGGNARRNLSQSKMKKVVATNTKTNEQIVFNSCSEAAAYFNVSPSVFSNWMHGKTKPSVAYTFEFYPPTTTERKGTTDSSDATV